LQPRVPDRVPQRLGDRPGIDVPVDEQQQVEVGLGRELSPSVAAERDERHAGRGCGALEQLDEPLVDERGVRLAEAPTPQCGVGDQPAARRGRCHRLAPSCRSGMVLMAPAPGRVSRAPLLLRPGRAVPAGGAPRGSGARSGHTASTPRSPVRILTTSSTGVTQTLPSPILSVRADFSMASTTAGTSLSSAMTSTLTFGRNSTWYSVPR